MPSRHRRELEVRVGAKRKGAMHLGIADSPSTPSARGESDSEERSADRVGFAPEWGPASPLSGGDAVERLRLPAELTSRLRKWTRVWQSGFDERAGWLDAATGRAWIAEGEALLEEVTAYARRAGLNVVADPDFHEYEPPKR
ncbi:hypothetical protein ACFUTX_00445 [Microbacterium sp. NPDC057407]|uniref:hypothetical protein n=1 Tax=Microbacterium sp. NPDC057407 TaxID=3346120 RepID=UPI00366D7BDD